MILQAVISNVILSHYVGELYALQHRLQTNKRTLAELQGINLLVAAQIRQPDISLDQAASCLHVLQLTEAEIGRLEIDQETLSNEVHNLIAAQALQEVLGIKLATLPN